MNLILIVSDTFRYDHISANGNKWIHTQELDKFAGEAVVLDRLYDASFPTIPHRTDLVTGRYTFPYRGWTPLADDDITLAQVLAEAGYTTQLIADTTHLIRNKCNFMQGFMGWHVERGQEGDIPFTRVNYPVPKLVHPKKARLVHTPFPNTPYPNLNAWTNREWTWEEDRFPPRTARNVSKWLEENYKADRFFLWVDFFDPHEPWNPPEFFVRMYDPDYDGPPMLHPNYGKASAYTRAELRNLRAHYAGEVTLVSKWIGYILRKVEDLGLDKNTIVVFTSDHGIYLGEHNRTGKSNINEDDDRGPWPLYEEISHIPFMIRVPGIKGGRRTDALVQPPDIMPTLLDLLGVNIPGRVQGESFAKMIRSPRAKWRRRYAFSSSAIPSKDGDINWSTIRDEEWTLLIGGKRPHRPELYHLPSDPGQTRNVLAKNRDTARRLHGEFVKFLRNLGTDEDKVAVVEGLLK